MLARKAINTKEMEKIIYIQLLEEGTVVYRAVPAIELGNNVYEVKGECNLDSADEIWEFKPGAKVLVEERELEGEIVLIAVREK